MQAIRDFCKKRKLGKKLEDAFVAYCKASVGDYFSIKSNETVTGLLVKFTDKEIENLWNKFVLDLRDSITQKDVS